MLHCMKKCGPKIDWCPLGEGIECLTVIQTLADRIQATACMLYESFRAWVKYSKEGSISKKALGIVLGGKC